MENLDVAAIRAKFPALQRRLGDREAVFLDGPAGSQVPQSVIDAIGNYLVHRNANHGGVFATSRESDAEMDQARQAMADFMGAADPDEIVFGANMTTMTFAMSRAISATWKPGDEVLVTRLDHDANVTPWVLAAKDRGVNVNTVEVHREDCTLDIEDFERKLTPKTRLVAIGAASNASGSVNPIERLSKMAKSVGALVYVDAVHYAPHLPLDVARWGADFVICSAYKFFGPHVGVLWGRRELLESITPYKVRPAGNAIPDRWMTGTPNFEGIAGVLAAVGYLAELGRGLGATASRREAILAAYAGIASHESVLGKRLLEGLERLPGVTIHSIGSRGDLSQRVPTVSISHSTRSALDLANHLAAAGIFTWHGNFYAYELSHALGLEPNGMLRIGILHYNTEEEIDHLLSTLEKIA